jgi:hypothetical protein
MFSGLARRVNGHSGGTDRLHLQGAKSKPRKQLEIRCFLVARFLWWTS